MFSGGTKKKDKKIVNSVINMNQILDDDNKEQSNNKNNNNSSSKNNNSIINNTSNTTSSHSNESQNNNEIDCFGFENIELPKEEDFGDFRVISNSDFIEVSSELNPPNPSIKLRSKCDNKNTTDLINLIIRNKTNKSKKNKASIKSYITSMYYNKNTTKHKFDMESYKSPCFIYDSSIKEILGDLDINYSNNSFLYMSYRSGFETLKNIGCGDYTSDCGWGCMLRCCQMMLSRGIFKSELYKLSNDKEVITKADRINLIKDILCLFNDNIIPFKDLESNKLLKNLYEKYHGNENNYELIPPYSIYTLCKLSKCSGVYASDLKVINSFIEINEQIFNNEFALVHFENGIVPKKQLLETFCNKIELGKDDNEDEKNIIINSITNNEELNDIKNIDKIDPMGAINIFDYYGEKYKFVKSGLVFLSLRLGLRDLDEFYFDKIPLLFQRFHNNIGFVSGKKNKAFYFIGFNGDNKLIYADPHLNQKADILDFSSYEVKDLYLLDVKELSSSLTIGININDSTDFKILIYELQWFYKNHSNILTFK